eukprot:PLAT12445.1.p1 GENE.PLAT12445.1~~PLAT12445.1.p1  ORF type:complete len:623 (+),score=292.84 PLAT12445.1:99-1967(+)
MRPKYLMMATFLLVTTLSWALTLRLLYTRSWAVTEGPPSHVAPLRERPQASRSSRDSDVDLHGGSVRADAGSSQFPASPALDGGAATHRSLLLVVPLQLDDIASASSMLEAWKDMPACVNGGGIDVTLLLLSGGVDSPTSRAALDELSMALAPELRRCFRHVNTRLEELMPIDDRQPAYENALLLTVLLDDTLNKEFDYAMWMPTDTRPVRVAWLDMLWRRSVAAEEPFWVKGSIFRGSHIDSDILSASAFAPWMGAMSKVALYRMGDPMFHVLLRDAIDWAAPSGPWTMVETSMWELLHHFPSQWARYQRTRQLFKFSSFVYETGPAVSALHERAALSDESVIFLRRSSDEESLAAVATARGRTSLPSIQNQLAHLAGPARFESRRDVCVIIASTERFKDEVVRNLLAVQQFIDFSSEVVLVVPPVSQSVFAAVVPPGVVVRMESMYSGLEEDIWLHNIYMRADFHCSSQETKFVMHLRPGLQIQHRLRRLDFIFDEKPILSYSSADGDDRSEEQWQKIMAVSLMLGAPPIQHEFLLADRELFVFPMVAYHKLRGHVEALHGTKSFEVVTTPDAGGSNSAFSCMAAFLFYHAHDMAYWTPLLHDSPDRVIKPHISQSAPMV